MLLFIHIMSNVFKGIRLPDHIILGAAKAGTSSIHHYLDQHPDVFVPSPKELKFFTRPGEPDRDEYARYFAPNTDGKKVMEVSSDYLYSGESTPRKIKKIVPDVGLIAILRDPVERGFSDFCMDVDHGKQQKDYRKALRGRSRFRYRNQGLYHKQLSRYIEVFDRERIGIFFFEDLKRDTAGFMRKLYRYIGVTEDVTARGHFNKGSFSKSEHVQALLNRPNPVRRAIKSILSPFLNADKRQRLRSRLLALNRSPKPRIDPELRSELVEFYRDDILKLQELTGRDLSAWLK
ncbi:MAG: hypothetical protein GF392_02810 [Candidatus Omnitrophica bacterium]|nr:hypothetical protein [Candidatus Omnitrophota bacterium]